MQVTRIAGKNWMGLKWIDVRLDPKSKTTRVGGRNSQGKTSLLRLLAFALAGKSAVKGEPVRKGAKRAYAEVDIDATEKELMSGAVEYEGLRITRMINAKGQMSVKLEGKDGTKYPKPQSILDQLIGPLCFDPLEFATRPDRREGLLKDGLGIDTSDLDEEIKAAEIERRDFNVLARNQRERLQAARADAAPPDVERIDVRAVIAQREEAAAHNAKRVKEERIRKEDAETLVQMRVRLQQLQEEMESLEASIDEQVERQEALPPLPEPIALEDYDAEIERADSVYHSVKARETAEQLAKELADSESKAQAASKQAKDMAEQRAAVVREAAEAANVPGLTWEDGEVLYNGTPFDSCSTTEQTQVSCAIAVACARDLPIMLVPNAGMLERENQKVIEEMAAQHDCHVFLEVPGDSEATLVIEAGEVKE